MYKNKDKYNIYLLRNKATKKVYVGCTFDVSERIQHHMRDLRSRRHNVDMMQADFDKYGEDSFEHEVFTTCAEKWEASRIETFMMKILKSQNPQFGYNYKDRKGNCPLGIADRWRTTPPNWSNGNRVYQYTKHGILLPPCRE